MAAGSRFASQAAQDSILRFAPQRTALSEALRTAQETYGGTVRAGNTTAALTQQAAKAAQPEIARIYQGANAAENPAVTLISKALAGLPGVANQYKADQASEVQQQLANLIGARSRDEASLAQQGVAARAGAQFNQLNARQALQRTVGQIIGKGNALGAEQGDFAATEAERLAHEAETLEQRERASERSATTSRADTHETQAGDERRNLRDNATREAAARRAAEGKGALTPKEQNEGTATIEAVRHYAGELGAGHSPRAELVALLTEGQPQGSHAKVVTKEGKTITEHIPVPKIPAYKPDVLMSAGIDLAEKGQVSRHTAARLSRAGYNVQRLGFPVESATQHNVSAGANRVAQQVGRALPKL